jgi:hypothetical protein
LFKQKGLHSRRASGVTCVTALTGASTPAVREEIALKIAI